MSEIDGILIVVVGFFFSFLISLRDLSFYMNMTVLEYFLGHFLAVCRHMSLVLSLLFLYFFNYWQFGLPSIWRSGSTGSYIRYS
jgi:hypothetical protein